MVRGKQGKKTNERRGEKNRKHKGKVGVGVTINQAGICGYLLLAFFLFFFFLNDNEHGNMLCFVMARYESLCYDLL